MGHMIARAIGITIITFLGIAIGYAVILIINC